MSKLELFLHDQPEPTPVLLKAARAHVQFETIHPFLDGNGRLGRLLIALLLCEQRCCGNRCSTSALLQDAPSVLLRAAQQSACDRRLGSLARFFAEAVIVTATQRWKRRSSSSTCRTRIATRSAAWDGRRHHPAGPPGADGASHRHLGLAGGEDRITPATVNKALGHLEQLGIVKELTAQKRNRLFSYAGYIEIMSRGTELPGR
jgi:Fic family protein